MSSAKVTVATTIPQLNRGADTPPPRRPLSDPIQIISPLAFLTDVRSMSACMRVRDRRGRPAAPTSALVVHDENMEAFAFTPLVAQNTPY